MCVCQCVCVSVCAYSLLTACGKCFSQRSVLKNVRLANKAVRKSWKLTLAGRRAGNQCRHFVKELPTSSKSWFNIHILKLTSTSTSTFTSTFTFSFTFGAACLIRHTKLVLQQQQKAQGDIFSFFPLIPPPCVNSLLLPCAPYAPSYFISSCFGIRRISWRLSNGSELCNDCSELFGSCLKREMWQQQGRGRGRGC